MTKIFYLLEFIFIYENVYLNKLVGTLFKRNENEINQVGPNKIT